MSQEVEVEVTWSEWKRDRLPDHGNYSTVSVWEVNDPDHWSVNLTNLKPTEKHLVWRGTASFLSPEGPDHRLVKGTVFRMIEGVQTSAEVRVL